MKILVFILLLLSNVSYSQTKTELQFPIDTTTNLISFSEIVVQNGKQKQLYSKAKEWFVKTFNSANEVIQMDDPENAKIIGKGFSAYESRMGLLELDNKVWYTITITSRDNKYKYSITDFHIESTPKGGKPIKKDMETLFYNLKNSKNSDIHAMYLTHQMRVMSKVESLIASIKSGMATKDDF